MLDDWQEWIAIGAMTLVGAFGVTAAIMAVGTRNGDMLSAIGADVAWCEADLAQVKRAKAQTEGRALIALRDATDLRRFHAQCRAECSECAPKLAAAEQSLAALREERKLAQPAPAPPTKPPAPPVEKAARAAPKRKQARIRVKPKPAPAWLF